MPAPAYAAQTESTGSATTSKAATVPAGTALNHMLLAFLYVETFGAVTMPSGWAEAGASPVATGAGSGEHTNRVYWKRATASESGSYTFSWSGSTYAHLWVFRYTGVITSGNPFDTGAGAPVGAQRSSNGTVMPAVSLTTQGADRLLVYSGMGWDSGTYTIPSGFNVAREATDVVLADKEQAVAGSTGSVSGGGPNNWMTAWMGALLPVPVATTAPPPLVNRYGRRLPLLVR